MRAGNLALEMTGGPRSLRRGFNTQKFRLTLDRLGGPTGVGGRNHITFDHLKERMESGQTIKSDLSGPFPFNDSKTGIPMYSHQMHFGAQLNLSVRINSQSAFGPGTEREIKIIEILGPNSHPAARGIFVEDIRKAAEDLADMIGPESRRTVAKKLVEDNNPYLTAHLIIKTEVITNIPREIWMIMRELKGNTFVSKVNDLIDLWQLDTTTPALTLIKGNPNAPRTDMNATHPANEIEIALDPDDMPQETHTKMENSASGEPRKALGAAPSPKIPGRKKHTGPILPPKPQPIRSENEFPRRPEKPFSPAVPMKGTPPSRQGSLKELIERGDLEAAAEEMLERNLAPGMAEKYLAGASEEMKRAFVKALRTLAEEDPEKMSTVTFVESLLFKI